MPSAATAHRLFAARPRSGALVDVAIAAVALAGSLAQLSHGGIAGSQTGPRELDWAAGVLAACSTAPLVLWRRAPWAVFACTASAVVLLGALGYPIALPLGPTAALYLLAASRDEEEPWTRRSTGTVVALFLATIGAAAVGNGGFPGSELLHTGLAWAVAWFAGERTRLRHEHVVELAERAIHAEREAERERLLVSAYRRPGSPPGRSARRRYGGRPLEVTVSTDSSRLQRDEPLGPSRRRPRPARGLGHGHAASLPIPSSRGRNHPDVGDLAGELPVSRPAVSQHLKVLKEAGLVIEHRAGTRRIYQLDPDGLAELRAQLDRFWSQALAAYKQLVEQATDKEDS